MPVNQTLANDTWNRYTFLRDNGHLKYVDKAALCEDFFIGEQWDKNDLALLKASRRPALTINKIISTVSNVLGEQIFNRTDISFKPRNEGATAEVADALTKVFMQIGDNNQLSWLRSDVFCDGVITGRGFFDARLDFTDSLRGEVRIEHLNPKNVLIDADADEYDSDKWGDVIVTKWMSPDQIEMLYGKADAEILRGRGESNAPYGYDAIDRDRDRFGATRTGDFTTGPTDSDNGNNNRTIRVIERQWRKLDKVLHLVDIETGDTRPVPTDWDEARLTQHLEQNPNLATTKKMVQRIRWTVVADNVVLHDDWSPYHHFTVVPYFPHFHRGRTIGLVENLIGPQEMLNKVSSQELHVVNTSANSGWMVERNNLQNMTVGELENRGAESGLVIELTKLDGIQKITPNATPTGLDRLSFKAEEHIKGISGVSDYMQGFAREDVAAKSVQTNKASGQANLARVMDNMGRTDTMLARNILRMVQEFYTEQRLIYITTDRLQNTTDQMTVNEQTPEGTIANDLTLGEYAVVVTSQPERDTFEETQFDQALRLRTEAGVQLPDKYIIRSSRLKDKAEILKEMEGDTESPEAQEAAAMQKRVAEAEVGKTEAESAAKQADAQLKQAKAQKEMAELQNPTEQNEMAIKQMELEQTAQLEEAKLVATAETERARLEQELTLKREMMTQEFALKREQLQMEMSLKREQAASEAEIRAKEAEDKAQADRIAAAHNAKPPVAASTTSPTSGAPTKPSGAK